MTHEAFIANESPDGPFSLVVDLPQVRSYIATHQEVLFPPTELGREHERLLRPFMESAIDMWEFDVNDIVIKQLTKDDPLMNQVADIVNYGYNSRYATDKTKTHNLAKDDKDDRETTVTLAAVAKISGVEIVLGTFRIVKEDPEFENFFDTPEGTNWKALDVYTRVAELGRFSLHPIFDLVEQADPPVRPLAREGKMLVLREIMRYGQTYCAQRGIAAYFILNTHVREFLDEAGIHPLELTDEVAQKNTPQREFVEKEWKTYWRLNPQVYRVPSKLSLFSPKTEYVSRNQEHESQISDREDYPGKPIPLAPETVRMSKNGWIIHLPHGEIRLPDDRITNHIDETFAEFGISSEDENPLEKMRKIVKDPTLAALLETEWEAYQEKLRESSHAFPYGQIFFYPKAQKISVLAPIDLHRQLVTKSNGTLGRASPDRPYASVQKDLSSFVVASMGLSVGQTAAIQWQHNSGADFAKFADNKPYKLSNVNRAHVPLYDVGVVNKGEGSAELIHTLINPYPRIFLYREGVTRENMNQFLLGNPETDEPRVDLLFEEADDIEMKIEIRKEARKHGIPVMMASDMGHIYQIDFRDFARDQSLSLAAGVPDEILFARLAAWKEARSHNSPTTAKKFYLLLDALIGATWRTIPEFRRAIQGLAPIAGFIPQWGSTVSAAGGTLSDLATQYAQGALLPERDIFNIRHGIRHGEILFKKSGAIYNHSKK